MLNSPPDACLTTCLGYASSDICEAVAFPFLEVTTVPLWTYLTPSTTPLTAVLIYEAESFAGGGKVYPAHTPGRYEMQEAVENPRV
jgi:hypothetical protein